MSPQALLESRKKVRRSDERYVWFAAMGLTIGLVMVAGLLIVVTANGLEVFWPKDVVEIRVAPERPDGTPGMLLGELTKQQEKKVRTLSGSNREWQVYTANKDAFGHSFVYVDQDRVLGKRSPMEALVVERMEYGDAIGYPVSIRAKDGATLEVSSPGFAAALAVRIREAAALRRQIRQIEKGRIGAINAKMDGLRLREKKLTARPDDPPALAGVRERVSALQARYEALAAEARRLRGRIDEDRLVLRLADGKERVIPFGQVVDAYHPNALSPAAKTARFVRALWFFLVEEPREANTEGGIFPAIFGTFVMTMLMSLAVMPFGVLAAIYLREYAKQGVFVRAVRIAVNNLAGVPSIVFGVFGLGFFVYFVGGSVDSLFFADRLPTPTIGTGGILWASLTLALMTVPVVIVATEEALAAVSRGVREGSLACGASKWQTIQRVVLPASAPGILTGLILAMARGAGEVAPLMLVGVVKLAPTLPLDGSFPFIHLERKFMHLGFHIYDLGFQSPDSEAAKPMVFATTLLLIILVVILNLSAIIIRERLRRKYATGAF